MTNLEFNKSRVIFKIIDYAKGTNIYDQYCFFKSFLKKNQSNIQEYQTQRLKSLLIHAQQTVPYYHKVFSDINFNPNKFLNINTLNKIPILERETIRKFQDDLISNVYKKNKLNKSSSSGTTGIPINYFFDNKALSAGTAAGYMLWAMSGWNIGMRNVHIWGNESSIQRWETIGSRFKNKIVNQINIASTLLNSEEKIRELSHQIKSNNPEIIDGYTSSIFSLAQYFKKEKIRLERLKLVLTTAENLENYQKELIEEIFAQIVDLYGSGKVLGIASKPAGDDKYYILDPHVIVETQDSGISGMKDIIVTDLDNFAMPLIRYRLGDMIDDVNEPLPGNKYPFRWFTRVYGRSSEIITLPNGLKFHPVNIFGGTLFRKFDEITRHKTIWDGKQLHFIFEAANFNRYDELYNALSKLLEPYKVIFKIDIAEKILPSPSGKYKYMEILNPLKNAKT